MTTYGLSRNSRPIGWIKAARKVFDTFPEAVRDRAPKPEIDLIAARVARLKREVLS